MSAPKQQRKTTSRSRGRCTSLLQGFACNSRKPPSSTWQLLPICKNWVSIVSRSETKTGGRPATTGVIYGRYALSVGMPDTPIPAGWRWTALTDIARLESGHTPSRKHLEYWDGEIPWIGIRDATENHGRIIHDTYQHTNELGIAHSSARILPPNTVCLSRTASVGYVVV